MANKKKQNEQPDFLQTLIISIGKLLWWLIKLPFGGAKAGNRRIRLSVDDRNYLASKRVEIERTLSSANLTELKQMLIEADKLVDHALKLQGFGGETFADRLRGAENSMGHDLYNSVWQGHKIRNEVVHEQGDRVSAQELNTAIEKLLKYLRFV